MDADPNVNRSIILHKDKARFLTPRSFDLLTPQDKIEPSNHASYSQNLYLEYINLTSRPYLHPKNMPKL